MKDEVNLDNEMIPDEFIPKIKEAFEPVVEQLTIRKSSKATKELAGKLIETGTKYKLPGLLNCGEKLSVAIKSFNITSIEKLVTRFITFYNERTK